MSACAGFSPIPEKPTVELAGLRVPHFRLHDPDLAVILRLRNPNAFDLPVNSLVVALELNDRAFADGAAVEPVTLPAHGSALAELDLHTHGDILLRTLSEMLTSPGLSLRYRARGRVTMTRFNIQVDFDTPGMTDLDSLLGRNKKSPPST